MKGKLLCIIYNKLVVNMIIILSNKFFQKRAFRFWCFPNDKKFVELLLI